MNALSFFDFIGQHFFQALYQIKDSFLIIYLSFRNTFISAMRKSQFSRFNAIFKVFLSQVYFSGVMSIPLISFVALATGSISVLGVAGKLSQFVQIGMIGKVMVMVVLREVSPLFTALIIIARSGTAVASEIGNMKVNKEIESLEVMGIDHYSFVLFPRIAGGVVSLVGLVFYFNIIALLGGYFVASMGQPIPFSIYMNSLLEHLGLFDITLITIKNIIAGFIIFTVCSYQGMSVVKSPHEVPQVTTRAVVQSISAVMFTNLLVTLFYYMV